MTERRRAGRRRRREQWAAGVAVAVAAVAVAAAVGSGVFDDEPGLRDGSVAVGGPNVTIARVPETYRVDYRVTGRGGGEVVTTSDRLVVRRPFESRLESYETDAPAGEPSSVQVARLGHVLADSVASEAVVLVRPPAPAPSDLRVDAMLPEALERGLVERRERREVLDRPCQVYRSSAGLGAARLTVVGGDEHVDSCIDAAGIVLEELQVADGDRILLRRVAVDVEEDVEVADELFETGEPTVPTDLGGGVIRELTATSRTPGLFFEPVVPDDFHRAGRFAVVSSATPDEAGMASPIDQRTTFVSDVLVRGTDVIVVDQGIRSDGERRPPTDPTDGVDVGTLGTAELIIDPNSSAVQVALPDRRFVRVSGTVPIDELLELTRALRRTPGGELEPLD